MLEQCSLEDDPELQEKWASLLANAASQDRCHIVYPPFGSILSKLTSLQVLFLDKLHELTALKMVGYLTSKGQPFSMAPFALHELSEKELAILYFQAVNFIASKTPTPDGPATTRAVEDWEFQVDLLEHHFGLLRSARFDLPGRDALKVTGYKNSALPFSGAKKGRRPLTLADAQSVKFPYYFLSQTGYRFVEACKLPKR